MRHIALLLFGVAVLVVSPGLALTGHAAEQDIAFETISLTHLRAGEIAPLFAPHFRYAGELAGSGASQLPPGSSGLLPDGVTLITAPSQSSRYLLVAGTAEAVAETRMLVTSLDVAHRAVQLNVKVYPSLPKGTSGWNELSTKSGVAVAARTLAVGENLRFPALPSGFQPKPIVVGAFDSGPEFVPLPPLKSWPQVLLCLMPHVRAGNAVTLYFGVGFLRQSDDPTGVVEQAWDTSAAESLSPGESLALRLSKGTSGITVIVTPAPAPAPDR